MSTARDLDSLPQDLKQLLAHHRFDPDRFGAWAAELAAGKQFDNRVRGEVTAPLAQDLSELPARESVEYARLERVGLDALAHGQCALVVLAGGMATRMGGVVKALVDAIPDHTFLDLRLREVAAMQRRAGRGFPLWLMTSHSTHQKLAEALGSRLDGENLALFSQHLSLRLTPEGALFRDEDGTPSEYAPGHGDLPDALKESGLLTRFVERGGRTIMIANIDNLGATVSPAILGWHLEHGAGLSCEVVDKVGSDRGGIPVRWDGRPVILEEFCLPASVDPSAVRVFNTNTFHVDARQLLELNFPWTFYSVTKTVSGKPAIQFERLVNELTRHMDTRFLRVPRDGLDARFLPVKDEAELKARVPQLTEIAKARGWI
jgi:UTP--glucose-1-phosphate uridylyltransferase